MSTNQVVGYALRVRISPILDALAVVAAGSVTFKAKVRFFHVGENSWPDHARDCMLWRFGRRKPPPRRQRRAIGQRGALFRGLSRSTHIFHVSSGAAWISDRC